MPRVKNELILDFMDENRHLSFVVDVIVTLGK